MVARLIACPYDLESAIVRAREKAGMKHEVMAALMGISSQQLSHQMARRGGYLSMPRFFMLANDPDGLQVLKFFWEDIASLLGIEDRDALALQIQRFTERFVALMDRVQARQDISLQAVEIKMVKASLHELDVVKIRA